MEKIDAMKFLNTWNNDEIFSTLTEDENIDDRIKEIMANEKFNIQMKMVEIAVSMYKLKNYLGKLFIFRNQCYEMLNETEAYTMLMDLAQKYNLWEGSYGILTNTYKILCIMPSISVPQSYSHDQYLAFNNAILDMNNFGLYPNDGSIFIIHKLNCNLLFDFLPTPVFDRFLYQTTCGDLNLMNRIREFLGICFTPDVNSDQFFYIFGKPAGGKSVILELLKRVWSCNAVSNIPMDRLGGRFDLSGIDGKILNIDSDMTESSFNKNTISAIKKISGRDTIHTDKKFRDPYNFRNTAKLICASNYPFSGRYEPGIDRRIVEIPFPNQVPPENRDPMLLDKLMTEIDGIIFKCLKYYICLRNNNYIFTPIDIDMYYGILGFNNVSAKPYYCIDTDNSITEFIEKCCVFSPDLKEHNRVIYDRYMEYCNSCGYSVIYNINEFTIKMKELLANDVRFSRFRLHNDNTNGIIGLGLR